jgi:hypothetical protein
MIEKQQQPLPPQAQAQMQQMNQMIEQLTSAVHEAHDQLDKKTIEIESRERIELAKIQTNSKLRSHWLTRSSSGSSRDC